MRLLARQLLALAPEDRRQLQAWLRRGAPPPQPDLEPLDYHQLLLWWLEERGLGLPATVVPIPGAVDPRGLAQALAEALVSFDGLRRVAEATDDGPRTRLRTPAPPSLEVLDHRHLDADSASEALARSLRSLASRPPVEAGNPCRIVWVQGDDGDLPFLIAHPRVGDFEAVGSLARWLAERALGTAGPNSAGPHSAWTSPAQGSAREQRDWLVGAEAGRRFLYWKQRLAGAPQNLGFPADRPEAPIGSLCCLGAQKIFGPDTSERLRSLAGVDSDPWTVLAPSLVCALLFRYTGHGDLCVAIPELESEAEVPGRRGLSILRCQVPIDLSSKDLLARVQGAVAGARDHTGLPYELLVDMLAEPDSQEPPWSRVLVGPKPLGAPSVESESGECCQGSVAWAGAELALVFDARREGLWVTPHFSPDRFDTTTVHRLLEALRRLASAMVCRPAEPIANLDVLSPGQRTQLIREWNDSATPLKQGPQSLVDLFEAQAVETPHAVALVHGDTQVTYRQLQRRAEGWARRLMDHGLGPEDVVGLYCGRGPALLEGLLGILRAGAAYLPIDLRFPRDRVEYMLADAAVRVVLTEENLKSRLPDTGAEAWALDTPEALEAHPTPLPPSRAGRSNLAYMLYTSGSTGRPKAVALEHRGAVTLIEWARERFTPADLERVLFCSALGFDLSVFEIFLPLATGGTVALAETPLSLADESEAPGLQGVTFINTVPTAMAELVRAKALPPGVRIICLAGEPLPAQLVEQIHRAVPSAKVVNLYGATEDSTHSTEAWIEPSNAWPRPHVGFPIHDTRIDLVDRLGRLAPVGATGEICLSGEGLARAYHGRPALTAAAFRPNPFSGIAGDRLYFTGDLGRRLPGGEVDCLGRRDRQVKLRGFRIELAEIEAVLGAEQGIREVAVLLRKPERGDPALVAYLVTDPDFLASVTELRQRVAVRLPEYMVPSFFVTLVGLPRTSSGKVDRRALLELADPLASVAADAAPRTPIEETLARLWGDLLGAPVPSIQASFFELGGHSVLATRLIAALRDLYGVALEVPDVYRSPSIEQLAALIEETMTSRRRLELPPLEAAERGGALGVSAAQRRAWDFEDLPGGRGSQNCLAVTHLHGSMERGTFVAALAPVVARHEPLRTRFEGRGESMVQHIEDPTAASMPWIDLTALPLEKRWREVSRLALVARHGPFDPEHGSLYRAWLVEVDTEDNVLVAVLHGSIGDTGSLGIFLRDVSRYYFNTLDGCPPPEVMPLQHADFVQWQNHWLRTSAATAAEDHWRTVLEGPPPTPGVLRSPGDPGAPPFDAGTLDFELPEALGTALEGVGKELGVSLFTLFLATFKLLLGGTGQHRDVLIGTPVAGRGGRLETEIMIGRFTHLLALRTRFEAHQTVPELLARVQETTRQAHAFDELPSDRWAEILGHDPIRATFSFDIRHPPPPVALRVLPVEVPSGVSNVDLGLAMVQHGGRLGGRWTFRRRALDADRVRALGERFEGLLRRICRGPRQRLDAFDVLE